MHDDSIARLSCLQLALEVLRSEGYVSQDRLLLTAEAIWSWMQGAPADEPEPSTSE